VSNTGNTAHSYRVALFGNNPYNVPLQVIVTKNSTMPASASCVLVNQPQSVVVSIIATLLVGGAIVVGGAKAIQFLTSPKSRSSAPTARPPIAGPTISGVVRGPDGQPLAGAECVVGTGENKAYAYPGSGRRRRDANATVSDGSGKFVLPKPEGNYAVMIRSPSR